MQIGQHHAGEGEIGSPEQMGKEERRFGGPWMTREKASEKSKQKESNQRDWRGQSLESPDSGKVEQGPCLWRVIRAGQIVAVASKKTMLK